MNGKDMLNVIRKMDDKYIEVSEGYRDDERMIHEAMKTGSYRKTAVAALALVMCAAAAIVLIVIKPKTTNEKMPTDNIGNSVSVTDKENTEKAKSQFTFNTKGFKEAYEKYCSLDEKSLKDEKSIKSYYKYLLYEDIAVCLGEPDIRYERIRGIDDDGVRNESNDIKYYVWTFDDGYRISACNGGNLPTDDRISYDYYTVYFECIFDGVKIEGEIDKLIKDESDIAELEDIINRIINRQSFDDEDYYKKTSGDGFCNFPYLYEYKTLTDKYTIQRFVDTEDTTESSDLQYPQDLIHNEEGHLGVYAVTSRNKNWDYYYLLAMGNHLDNHPAPAKNLIDVKNLLGEPDRIEDLNGKEVYCYVLGEFTLKTYEGEERIVRKLIYNDDEVIHSDEVKEETKPEQTQTPEPSDEPSPYGEGNQNISFDYKQFDGTIIQPTIEEHDRIVSEDNLPKGHFDNPAADRPTFQEVRFFETEDAAYVAFYEDDTLYVFDGNSLKDSGKKTDSTMFYCSEPVNGAAYVGGTYYTSSGDIKGIFSIDINTWEIKRIIDTSDEEVTSSKVIGLKLYYVTCSPHQYHDNAVFSLKCYDIEKNTISCLISRIPADICRIIGYDSELYFDAIIKASDNTHIVCHVDPKMKVHVLYAGDGTLCDIQEDKIYIYDHKAKYDSEQNETKGYDYYLYTYDKNGRLLNTRIKDIEKDGYDNCCQYSGSTWFLTTFYKGKLLEYNTTGFSLYDQLKNRHERIMAVDLSDIKKFEECDRKYLFTTNVINDKLYIYTELTDKLYEFDGKNVRSYDVPEKNARFYPTTKF